MKRDMVPLHVFLSVMLFVWGGSSAYAASRGAKVTVVDRSGNRFEVSNFKYQKQDELIFSTGTGRSRLKFKNIKKITFKGEVGDEQQPISITLTNGRSSYGTIFVGGPSSGGMYGGYGAGQIAFSGETKLGRFVLPLKRTKEVIFHHEKVFRKCPVCGTMFDQEGYIFCPYHGRRLETVEADHLPAPAPEDSSGS